MNSAVLQYLALQMQANWTITNSNFVNLINEMKKTTSIPTIKDCISRMRLIDFSIQQNDLSDPAA